MKISLVATVLNGADHVEAFLGSLADQTRAPDEIVVVDGGSTDGTLEILRSSADVAETVVEAGAGIARGRNVAIARATHDVIAVADADCWYEPSWLEELLRPLDAGADVAMGWYEPVVTSFLDACVASINLPLDASEVDESAFMPSARSVAFRRGAIEAVGGYPEWLPIGEDMWVDLRWRELGMDMRFAPAAVARWRLRPTLRATWLQYFRYARGDAHAGMYPERHAVRFGVYGALAASASSRRTWPRVAAVLGGAAYARTPLRRAWRRLDRPSERALATVIVPPLMAFVDTAKMAGYAVGLADRGPLRR
jgi:cellulose synthase/poly-beta-1,6-N-acetylglucosamine synthase-like glycosyltransferase